MRKITLFFDQATLNSICFTFISTVKGLYLISLRPKEKGYLSDILKKSFGNAIILEKKSGVHNPVVNQIKEYLAGRRRTFSVPLDIYGTAFQKAVWEAIRTIPYGQTRSYQEVAKAVGKEKAARAVGQAAHANPLPLIIPCHRLIGSSGRLVGFSSGLDLKAKLLALENKY